MRSVHILIAAVIILTGCASTSGNKFATTSIHNIKTGVSTKEDVVAVVGPAPVKNSGLDGTSVWTYSYVRAQATPSALSFVPIVGSVVGRNKQRVERDEQRLTVTFNKSNIVSNCVYTTYVSQGTGTLGYANQEAERIETACENVKDTL
jgi:hypothetical protein